MFSRFQNRNKQPPEGCSWWARGEGEGTVQAHKPILWAFSRTSHTGCFLINSTNKGFSFFDLWPGFDEISRLLLCFWQRKHPVI